MARTMKAGVVHAFGKPLTIEEVPIPTPGPGELLIKVIATGVCHTDLHAADGDWPGRPSLPVIPGHLAKATDPGDRNPLSGLRFGLLMPAAGGGYEDL
jgi:alcohol dehydrogenase, propanol-preferring